MSEKPLPNFRQEADRLADNFRLQMNAILESRGNHGFDAQGNPDFSRLSQADVLKHATNPFYDQRKRQMAFQTLQVSIQTFGPDEEVFTEEKLSALRVSLLQSGGNTISFNAQTRQRSDEMLTMLNLLPFPTREAADLSSDEQLPEDEVLRRRLEAQCQRTLESTFALPESRQQAQEALAFLLKHKR